jgi:hypothetical protein
MTSPSEGWAAESGHWYYPDGRPAYSIVGKNGKERATTLRDARKLGLLPSVTGITNLAAKPGLERWKAEQVLLAALTLQRHPNELESMWIARVWEDSRRQAADAADRGTAIHAAIECYYSGKPYDAALRPWVEAAETAVRQSWGDQVWSAERSFADPQMGYGGKVDLHSDGAVIDFKGKEGDPDSWKIYDDHRMQLAAYAMGLGLTDARCGIVFVSRTAPIAVAHVMTPDDILTGSAMFLALLDFWKASKRVA